MEKKRKMEMIRMRMVMIIMGAKEMKERGEN